MPRIACQLSDILNAVAARLVAVGIVTDSQVYMNFEPNDVILSGTPTPPLASIAYNDMEYRFDTQSCESDATEEPTHIGELRIALWTRIALDQPGRDTDALTNATMGISQLVRRVKSAFINQQLVNPSGDEITWRTLNYLGKRNMGRYKGDDRRFWRRTDVRFDVCWEESVEIAPPGVGNALIWNDDTDTINYSATGVMIYG